MSLTTVSKKGFHLSFPMHLQKVLPIALKVWAITMFFFVGVLLLGQSVDVPIGQLTREPAAIMNAPYYFGLLSNFGALIWSAAATICFFGYTAARQHPSLKKYSSFYLASGLLTTLLLLDDFFLMHEEVFPKYLGVHEKLAIAFYGACMMLYLIVHKNTILKSEYLLLGASLFFLSFSAAIDAVPFAIPGKYIFEDGIKFVGITTWLLYFGRMVLKDLPNYHSRNDLPAGEQTK